MLYWIKFFYSFILPPGVYIVMLLILTALLFRRQKRMAAALLTVTLLLYISSIPIVGSTLMHTLERKYNPPHRLQGDVYVMLTGGATAGTPDVDGLGNPTGSTANRLLSVCELYKKHPLPIIVSGGQVFKDSGNEAAIVRRKLSALGVPNQMIILDSTSRNTTENAEHVKALLQELHYDKPVLITSAFHMARAIMDFHKLHVSVIPYPVDYRVSERNRLYLDQFKPSAAAAQLTATALKEYLGMLAISVHLGE